MQKKMQPESLIPTIGVTDLDAAIQFYEKLGFSKEWKWPEKESTHASVSWDRVNIMMVRKESEDIAPADLYIRFKGTQSLHEKLKSSGLIVSEMSKADYGMLDFSLKDPWNNFITFGEPHGEFEG